MEKHTHNNEPCLILRQDELGVIDLVSRGIEPAIQTRFSKDDRINLATLHETSLEKDGLHLDSATSQLLKAAARYTLMACNVTVRELVANEVNADAVTTARALQEIV